MTDIQRIHQLIEVCKYHSKKYYVEDQPEITDKEYDSLYQELTTLEQSTGFVLSSSPTQKVQGKVVDYLQKVQHTEPMLSAEKSKDINDVIKFMGNQDCLLSWKLDGLTLVLRYNHGKLQQSITRGGGTEGEDVTHTVATFTNIPLTIDYKGYLELRGEGLMSFGDFERINNELLAKGEETFKSARNLAGGSVRQLNANVTKARNCFFIAFGIVRCDAELPTKYEQFNFLSSLGFEVVYYETVTKDTLQQWVNTLKDMVENLLYPTDGLIVEYNDIAYGKAQGFTEHHSKALFALKWQDDSYETIFRGVELNTTRTGICSITAIFDETNIDGVRVSRASLHNYDIFKSLQLGVEDIVTVYRANMVIPQLEENLTRSDTYKIDMICPSCGGDIVIRKPKETRFLFCVNDNCPAKLVDKFVHFCSKDAMNIDGLSGATLDKFINKGWLKTFADIYKLDRYKSQIIKMEGFGLKSYLNIMSAIEESRIVKMENFLVALGIDQIGKGGAKRLAKHFGNDIDLLLFDAISSNYDFSRIEDFGQITADALYKYFKDEENMNQVNELLQYITIKQEEKKGDVVVDNPFNGKKIYATGTFANFKKEEIKTLLESLGAEFGSGYAKSLDFLIVGSLKGSGKETKALADGVPILTEDQFLTMIGRS